MKTIAQFSLVLISCFLFSCKKNYTCSCTNVIYQNGGTIVRTTETGKEYSIKMTKKQAESACNHEKVTIDDNTTDQLGGDPNFSSSATCVVK